MLDVHWLVFAILGLFIFVLGAAKFSFTFFESVLFGSIFLVALIGFNVFTLPVFIINMFIIIIGLILGLGMAYLWTQR